MKINEKGIQLIKEFEGCRLEAYKDTEGIWTIGYGHTAGVKKGQVISQNIADIWLHNDVQWAEKAVSRLVTYKLNENQFSALVSFVFNVGSGNFEASTLLKKLNGGNIVEAGKQILRWDKGGDGKPVPGLTRRRLAEKALFEEKV